MLAVVCETDFDEAVLRAQWGTGTKYTIIEERLWREKFRIFSFLSCGNLLYLVYLIISLIYIILPPSQKTSLPATSVQILLWKAETMSSLPSLVLVKMNFAVHRDCTVARPSVVKKLDACMQWFIKICGSFWARPYSAFSPSSQMLVSQKLFPRENASNHRNCRCRRCPILVNTKPWDVS